MKKEKCINPYCDKKQHSRGLCSGCYGRYVRILEAGIKTEDEMIAEGRIYPINHDNGFRSNRSMWLAGDID